MDNLQLGLLRAAFAGKCQQGGDVVVHRQIDSTNSWAMRQCRDGKALPFACFAEEQSLGRGRRGKHWLMSAHKNIAMSLAWPVDRLYRQMHLLPLAIALAITETLEGIGLTGVQIKWPNDVYVRGKKIAGVLVETQPFKDAGDAKKMAIIIGIGLNYDMSLAGLDRLPEMPVLTDICNEFGFQCAGAVPGRTEVAALLLANVVSCCQSFQLDAGRKLEKFRRQYDYCKNKNVEIILDNEETLSGVVSGVNDRAELLVSIDGVERAFNSAQVSVKADG